MAQLQELLKKFKDPSLDDHLDDTWSKLAQLLSSDWSRKQGLNLRLPPQLVNKISKSLKEGEISAETRRHIFACVKSLQELPISEIMFAKYDTVLQYLSAALFHANVVFESMDTSAHEDADTSDALIVLKALLGQFLKLVSTHGMGRKLFTSITSNLLEPVIVLHHRLQGGASDLVQVQYQLRSITQHLTVDDCLSELQNYLLSQLTKEAARRKKKTTVFSYVEVLFTVLESLTASPLSRAACLAYLPILLEQVLQACQDSSAMKRSAQFLLVVKFAAMLGYTCAPDGHVTTAWDQWNSEELELALGSLAQCLKLLKDFSVYVAVEDDGSQLLWLQSFAQLALVGDEFVKMSVLYECFETVIQLNHSAVEPSLVRLWKRVTGSEEIPCGRFCNAVIDTYFKLHQMRKFLELVLDGCKDEEGVGSGEVAELIPSASRSTFVPALSHTPLGQCREIVKMVSGRLMEASHPWLGSSEDLPKKAKRRKMSKVSDRQCVSLVQLGHLIGLVLCNVPVRVWQGDGSEPAVEALDNLNNSYIPSALDTIETLPEDSVVYKCLCTCVMLVMHATYRLSISLQDAMATDPELPVWVTRDRSRLVSSSLLCGYVNRQLCVLDVMSGPVDTREECSVLDSISELTQLIEYEGASWNGNILSITDEVDLLATAHTVFKGLPYLWQLISEDDLTVLSDLIIQVLTAVPVREESSKAITLHAVCCDFLRSDSFQNMQPLHISIVNSLQSFVKRMPKTYKLKKNLRAFVMTLLSGVKSDEELNCMKFSEFFSGLDALSSSVAMDTKVILKGLVEMVLLIPIQGLSTQTLNQLIHTLAAADVIATVTSKLGAGEGSVYEGHIRTVLAWVLRLGKGKGISHAWYSWLFRWVWSTGSMITELAPSLLLVQTMTQLVPHVDSVVLMNDIKQLHKTSCANNLFLQVIVQEYCSILRAALTKNKLKQEGKDILSDVYSLVKFLYKQITSHDQGKEELPFMSCDSHVDPILTLSGLLIALLQCCREVPDSDQQLSILDLLPFYSKISDILKSYDFDESGLESLDNVASCVSILLQPCLLAGSEAVVEKQEEALSPCDIWETYLHLKCNLEKSLLTDDNKSILSQRIKDSLRLVLQTSFREDLNAMFKSLMSLLDVRPSDAEVVVFLEVWRLVLAAKLRDEGRREVRTWMGKVVLVCSELLCSRDEYLIQLMLLGVVEALSDYPSHVGMDTQSVRVLLHGLSCMQLRQQSLNGKTTYKLLGSLAKVSLLLWRHYEDTLLDDYITFVAILRKILQEVGVTAEDASPDKEDCCKTFIRITECFQNKRTVLARYAPYVVNDIVNTLQSGCHGNISKLLTTALHNMFNVCGNNDLAFLKAAVDPSVREIIESLYSDYIKHFKFTGKI